MLGEQKFIKQKFLENRHSVFLRDGDCLFLQNFVCVKNVSSTYECIQNTYLNDTKSFLNNSIIEKLSVPHTWLHSHLVRFHVNFRSTKVFKLKRNFIFESEATGPFWKLFLQEVHSSTSTANLKTPPTPLPNTPQKSKTSPSKKANSILHPLKYNGTPLYFFCSQ